MTDDLAAILQGWERDGWTVVLSTSRGGWKAFMGRGDIRWDATEDDPRWASGNYRYATGRSPLGAVVALRDGKNDEDHP